MVTLFELIFFLDFTKDHIFRDATADNSVGDLCSKQERLKPNLVLLMMNIIFSYLFYSIFFSLSYCIVAICDLLLVLMILLEAL